MSLTRNAPKTVQLLVLKEKGLDYGSLEEILGSNGFSASIIYLSTLNVEDLIAKDCDAVLCGYDNARTILSLIAKTGLDIPVILFTDPIGEEKTAELMRHGIFDIVLTSNPSRIIPVISDARHQKSLLTGNSRQKLRHIIGSNLIGITLGKANGEIVEVNDYFLDMLGYTREEFEQHGLNWRELTPLDQWHKDDEAVAEFRENNCFSPFEKQYLHKNGSRVDILIKGVRISNFVLCCILDISRVKRAEEALMASEARMKLLVEGLEHYGICLVDPQGIVLEANRAAEQVRGFKPGTMIGQHFSTFFTPEEKENKVPEKLWEEVTTRGRVGRKAWYSRPDGTRYYADSSVTAIYDAEENLVGFANVCVDLTEQKQAEEALKEIEQRFENTFEQAAVGIGHVGLNGEWLLLNGRYCEILGYGLEELMGRTFQDVTHPEDLMSDLAMFEKLKQGEISHYSMEKRYIRKNGAIVWVHLTVSMVRNDDGQPAYSVAVIEDITRRKQTELALQESEERFRTLASCAPIMIWITDTIGNVIYANKSLIEQSYLSPREFYGLGWKNAVHPEDWPQVEEVFFRALLEQRPYKGEARFRHADGTWHWVIASGSPQYTPDGKYISFIGTCLDITDRKQMEFELEKSREMAVISNERKSVFLSHMSHELRTPLHTVISGSALCLEEFLGPLTDKQREYLKMINRSGEHLLGIINDLLDISKIEAGKFSIHFQPVNLTEILSEVDNTFTHILAQKNQRLEVVYGKKLPESISSDPLRLKQIISNLLSNAHKFSPEGKTIGLEILSPDPDHVMFVVRDEGVGIAPEDHERIFLPFEQGIHEHMTQIKGTGLGLPITRKLVELHHGKISVESEPGKGSRFIVCLPLYQPEDENQPSAALRG